jgi:methylated-DNA-[protein]-cysteine S-methyltransferase
MTLQKSPGKNPQTAQAIMETPLGLALLFFSSKGLQRLAFVGEKDLKEGVVIGSSPETQALPQEVLKNWHDRLALALEDYFGGNPARFDSLDLDPKGTAFQLRVWQELRKIPYGETVSYWELGRRLGNSKASRAVGQANARNPIPLIIPCHRVIAADGSLGGYSSGLDRKRWLLEHEQAM